MLRPLVTTVLLLLIAGCGREIVPVRRSEVLQGLSQECQTDDDCILVANGCDACTKAAISAAEAERYRERKDAMCRSNIRLAASNCDNQSNDPVYLGPVTVGCVESTCEVLK